MKKNDKKIDSEAEMLLKLNQEKDKRAKNCWNEIEAALKKYRCEIIPIMHISTKGMSTTIDITAT